MKNNVNLQINDGVFDYTINCNFGWSIDSNLNITFSNNQLWEISPKTMDGPPWGRVGIDVWGEDYNNNIFVYKPVDFICEQTGATTYEFTGVSNELKGANGKLSSPFKQLTMGYTTITVTKPTLHTVSHESITINTAYSSVQDGVICKLYNKSTKALVETKSKSTDSQVTFNNLDDNTDYIAVVTYVCVQGSNDYSYDNFVEVTTSPKVITVFGNDNTFKAGELYASPNKDGVFKEVTALYYKDANNAWKKLE